MDYWLDLFTGTTWKEFQDAGANVTGFREHNWKQPLHSVCSFLPYSALCKHLDEAKNVIRHLKPEFLDDIAETYDPADEVDA